MPPAIEGMQHTHRRFLIVRRTCLHDGTHQNLQQSAANGIDCHRDQNAYKRIRQKLRQECQRGKPDRRQNVRKDHGCPVTDPVDKGDGNQIDNQLQPEVEGNQHCNFRERNIVCALKRQKEQRRKIVDDRLHNISDKTRCNSLFVIDFPGHKKILLSSSLIILLNHGKVKKFLDYLTFILKYDICKYSIYT